jgi:hypothetical protein
LRWINGWDSKWSEILPRYRKASEIFAALGLNDLEFGTADDINEYVGSLYPAGDYFGGKLTLNLMLFLFQFLGGLMGPDKEGNIIVVQSIGKIHPKSLVLCGRVSDVFYLSIIEAALTMKLIK